MFRFLGVTFLLLVTGLGVWLASSLVAFAGGPAELACVGGVLLFPVFPLWWEKRATDDFYAKLKRSTRLLPKKRALTPGLRIALRTVFINLVFIAALLALWPKVAFAALATRGDWFLGDRKGPWVDRTRTVLVASASGLEWLHEAAHENPYRTKEDEQQPVPDDVKPMEITTRFGSGARWRRADPKPTEPTPVPSEPTPSEKPPTPTEPTPTPEEKPEPEPWKPKLHDDEPSADDWQVGETHWPWNKAVHPVVAGMLASDEDSPEAVARYISARVTDPFERVKALHDWVVTRLHYDHDSVTGRRKPQDARTVFSNRMGVCEGYARLLVELGRLTGDRIVYVTGDVRDHETGDLVPVGHAWNAVQLKGAWYLMDATWDDPTNASDPNKQSYRTDYLFIPPQFMGLNHFPDDTRWQLRTTPLSRAEFLRQPLATPALAREHIALVSPSRPLVDVDDEFEVKLENPARSWVMLTVGSKHCGQSNDANLSLRCDVPRGTTEAAVFVNRTEQYGEYDHLLSFKLQ